MISFGAAVGMGFYVRTGTIHRVGGSSAVVYSYVLLGLLSFAVMHPLTRMLRIWPVRAPLMSFVEVFVNKEIGLLVGILYW
jgi:amino acid transporter